MKVVQYASVEKLYQQFPAIRKQDVKELDLWVKTQLHLPSVSGKHMVNLHNMEMFYVLFISIYRARTNSVLTIERI